MERLINGRTPEQIKYGLRCGTTGEHECSECAYYGKDNERYELHEFDCCEIERDALAYIEHLEVALKCEQVARTVLLEDMPKWISVQERLPEAFVSVLVQMPGETPHPTVREGFISNDGIWCAGHFRRDPDEITHWAKMPEPPEEVE